MDGNIESFATVRLFVVFFGVFLISLIFIRTRSRQLQKHLPPSIPSLPIIGSYIFMRCGGLYHKFFTEKSKSLGPVFSCRFGSQHWIVLNDRQSIQEALIRKSVHFSDRFQTYSRKHYFHQKVKGILYRSLADDFQRYQQQILSILQEFGLGQIRMEQRILREVEDLIVHIDSMQGRAFDPENSLSLCTMNIIASILFARRYEQTDSELQKIKDNVHYNIHSPKYFILYCPVFKYVPYFKKSVLKAQKGVMEIVEIVKKQIQSSLDLQSTVPSFVASYIEREGGVEQYDRNDLNQLCLDLLEAGSDTTATTITWSLALLANHPDVQKRLHEELDAKIPPHRLPNSMDMGNVPFVEATILEVLRITAVVPLALPHKVTDDTTVAGYYVAKGTMVFPNLHAVHMDESVWGDPEVFRPDRFLDESGLRVIGRNRIIPFSIGRRSCLGERIARQELFLMFSSLLQRFEVLPPEGQTKVECRETPAVVVAPSEFKVRMIPRMKR